MLHYVCVMISEKLLAEVQSRLFFHKITKKKHKVFIFFFSFFTLTDLPITHNSKIKIGTRHSLEDDKTPARS